MNIKICSKCKSEKIFNDFPMRKGKPDSWCKECYRTVNKAWRNSEKAKEWIKNYQSTEEYKDKKSQWGKVYKEKNRDVLIVKKREQHQRRKERHKQIMAKNYVMKREQIIAKVAEYKKENPDKVNAWNMSRLAQKKKAQPSWLTEDDLWMIKEAYHLAKLRQKVLGGKWHVDHIVPLRGKTVSGLHVPWNLQVITAQQNCAKRNYWSD